MSTNATCFHKSSDTKSPPLIQNGKIVLQTHHIGWIVTGTFALISTAVSFWLVNKHLRYYTNKHEQRYIVRILFMVPIYSLVSFASYLFWDQSTALLLLRDCYESTVLTSFFYLLLLYVSPNPDEQRTIFLKAGLSKENDRKGIQRGEPVKKWIFPLGSVKSKPADGLYFLQMMKWGILQYCVIRPLTTLVAVILDYVGLYCEDSWSPGWGHVYIVTIVSISVSIAMYCLIQIYVPISKHLAPHRPLLKLFAIKAVVFLTFWQATLLSVLSSLGVVTDTKYMTADDINIGIGAILETVEMTIFAILHIKAFSYKPYQRLPRSSENDQSVPEYIGEDVPRMPRMRCLLHAFDFRETLREIWEGCAYIFRKWRGFETDPKARRLIIREDIFGEKVPNESRPKKDARDSATERHVMYQPVSVSVEVEKEVHIDVERQWLGTAGDYLYGLGFPRRERTAGFEEQVEIELEKRGLSIRSSGNADAILSEGPSSGYGRRQRSWWRKTLDRMSRTSIDDGSISRSTDKLRREQLTKDDHDDCVGLVNDLPSLDTRGLSPHDVSGGIRRLSSTEFSVSPDPVFSRLFPSQACSLESGGPSSQTHISSRGHHIRLTTPASVVPANEPRALEQKPVLTNIPESDLGSRTNVVERGSFTRRGAIKPYTKTASRQARRLSALREDHSSARPGRHYRERAYHARPPPIRGQEQPLPTCFPDNEASGLHNGDARSPRSRRNEQLPMNGRDHSAKHPF
ncbi:hypothetical protein ACEPAG_4118 [Sanghuangporus baumii]